MPRVLLASLLILTTGFGGVARAQDAEEDEFIFEDEPPPERPVEEKKDDKKGKKAEDATPTPAPAPPPLDDDPEDDEDLLFEDEVDEEGTLQQTDVLEGDAQDTTQKILEPGVDTPRIYRARSAGLEGLPADEQVMGWEAYLEEYPNSVFRETIEARMDELLSSQYQQKVDGGTQGGGNAADAELYIVQGIGLPNLNPRTRFQIGFDLGFGRGPVFVAGLVDFEYAFLRRLSVHGGFTGRYSGWGLEAGARYAFVKSAKDQIVATVAADVRFNFSPLTFQVRPQIGFAKLFGSPNSVLGRSQLLFNVGAEFGTRGNETVGLFSGLNVTIRLAQPVALYVEADVYLRNLTRFEGPFVFQTVALGFKFFPNLKKRADADADPLEVGVGATVPSATQYLSYYQAAASVQGVYNLAPRGNSGPRRKKRK